MSVTATLYEILPSDKRLWAVAAFVLLCLYVPRLFTVPSQLRHLPCVPLLPLLFSYLSGEVEYNRFKRLVLPFANQRGEGIVLVWALGRWMIHVLDPKLARSMSDNIQQYPKEQPPDDLLLWRLIGSGNMLQANGETWKKHSTIVKGALIKSLPLDLFALLSRRVFAVIGEGGPVRWDVMSQRFALDAVGTSVLGHDFDAIRQESQFVNEYNGIMHGIANPFYLIMPFLEIILPRKELLQKMENMAASFRKLLNDKRQDPGEDIMTFMLKSPELSDEELRDNMILLFIAGHDTSAGAISSLVYFLASHPTIQARAREEILSVLGPTDDPTVDTLQKMPFLTACIREALRINTPISYLVPRTTFTNTRLGKYDIPANSSLILNIYVSHHCETNYREAYQFNPDRYLVSEGKEGKGEAWEEGWMPFGLGPRQCPARNFAMYEQRVLLAMLLREYELTLPEKSIHKDEIKNAFSPFALSLPYDLDIVFKKRG